MGDFGGFSSDALSWLTQFDPSFDLASTYSALNLSPYFTAGTGDKAGTFTPTSSLQSLVGSSGGKALTSLVQKATGLNLSDSEALMGANAVFGLLAALSARPSTTTTSGSSGSTGSSSSKVELDKWYDDLQQGLGTMLADEKNKWTDLDNLLTGGTKKWSGLTEAEQKTYVDPYVNSVLAPQLTRMSEDFLRGENSRRAKAGMIGAFGGSRDILEGSLAKRQPTPTATPLRTRSRCSGKTGRRSSGGRVPTAICSAYSSRRPPRLGRREARTQ